MRKCFWLILILVSSFLLFSKNVKAEYGQEIDGIINRSICRNTDSRRGTYYDESSGRDVTVYNNTYECQLIIEVKNTTRKNKLSFGVSAINVDSFLFEKSYETSYQQTGNTSVEITLYKTPLTASEIINLGNIIVGTQTINFEPPEATVKFISAVEHSFGTCQTMKHNNRYYYYGKDGSVVDELTYQKECVTHTCEVLSDGTKYGSSSTIVNDLDYQKQCMVNKCKKLSDGTIYGKDGSIVDELTYQKECVTHTCEVLSDGTKYGSSSTIVNDLDYQKQCMVNKCKKLSDGTIYGKDGSIVDELTYQKECVTHTCEVLSDGTKYGSSSTIVNDLEYQKQCKINKCVQLSDGTYYGVNATVVTEAVYHAECDEKIYCELKNNKYYGKTGIEVSEYRIPKTMYGK